MNKGMICFLFFILFLFGCNEQETTQREEQTKESEPEETIEVVSKEEDSKTDLMKSIEGVVVTETLEQWLEAKPGILIEDNRSEETSGWPFMSWGLGEKSKKYLGEITGATQDVDLLFKGLVYLYGNRFYNEVLTEQIDYVPQFAEPYLPEPELVVNAESKTPKPDYAILLLDASSSMLSSVDNQPKIDIAKNAVKRFANTLGSDSNISLIVYGHGGTQSNSDKQLSCSTIDEIVPMGSFKEEPFSKAVNGVEAKGWTPLAAAIKKAHQLSMNYDGNIIVYIVSDGKETCDGDPIKEASEFVNNEETRHVNIIGFDVDQEAENQLKAVADAGNGEYISADTIEDLNSSITQKWVLPSMLDIKGKQLNSPKSSFGYLFTQMDVQNKSSTIFFAVNRETSRFHTYIDLMKSNKMISEEVHQQLIEKNEAYKEKLHTINDELEVRKLQEVDDEVERIDQKINDWAARMEALYESRPKN
ncbi:MAG: VWA domain-containing protein [Lysinibacillus sp.]